MGFIHMKRRKECIALKNTDNKILKCDDIMRRLMDNPFFRYMDISAIRLEECEEYEEIEMILRESSLAVVFVEKNEEPFSDCIKRLCWKGRGY